MVFGEIAPYRQLTCAMAVGKEVSAKRISAIAETNPVLSAPRQQWIKIGLGEFCKRQASFFKAAGSAKALDSK